MIAAGVAERVVLTSSAATIAPDDSKEIPLSEQDWWSGPVENGFDEYRRSKKMAEQAAWELAEKHNVSLTAINPSFVIGPPRTPRIDSESLQNMKTLLDGLEPPHEGSPMCDVRDVAKAHILAAETAEAGGHRFIISSRR